MSVNLEAYMGEELGAGGRPAALKLLASIVIPSGYGLVWKDANGKYWQQTLLTNPDGTVDLQLAQVSL